MQIVALVFTELAKARIYCVW